MMRNRRPSVPVPAGAVHVGTSSVTTSTTRVAKSSEGHGHGGLSHSTLSSNASATPQQKIVQVLVARLKSKVSFSSSDIYLGTTTHVPALGDEYTNERRGNS